MEMRKRNFGKYETDELGDLFSDFYKDIFGSRPRHINVTDRQALIEAIVGLDKYMLIMRSTKIGRNNLRDNGWYIPEYLEEDGWVSFEQRLAEKEAQEHVFFHAPMGYVGERYEYLDIV